MWLSVNVLKDKIELEDLKRTIYEEEKIIITTIIGWIEQEYSKKIKKVPTFKSIIMNKEEKGNIKISFEIDKNFDLSTCKDTDRLLFKNISFLNGYAGDLKKMIYNAYGLFFKNLVTWKDFEVSDEDEKIILFEKDNLNNMHSNISTLSIKNECYLMNNNNFVFDANFLKDKENFQYIAFMLKIKKTMVFLSFIDNVFNENNKTKNIYLNIAKGKVNITTNTRKNSDVALKNLDFMEMLLNNSIMSFSGKKRINISRDMQKNEILDLLAKEVIELSYQKDFEKVKNILCLKLVEDEKNILSEYINNETKIRKTIKRI